MTSVQEATDSITLIDHHCHGLWVEQIDRAMFELSATESDWPAPAPTTAFDSPLGLLIRAECAPVLGLPRYCSPEDYLAERSRLGEAEVARRMLGRSGIGEFLVDTGYRGERLTTPEELSVLSGSPAHHVTRLEALAEGLASGVDAAGYASAVRQAIHDAAPVSVGFKSIIAYRFGLDFDPHQPSTADVERAAGEWLRRSAESGTYRLDHPVLLRHLLWEAVPLGLPIQFHVGFGDADITLSRCDPSLMTEFMRRTVALKTPIMLLHCYPFIREAGILAHLFPHVYLDTSLALPHTAASATRLVRDSLELTPFGKLLFSTDAFGLPELYLAGALTWRRGVSEVFGEWVSAGAITQTDALRYVSWIGAENARRVYRLGDTA